MCSLGGLISNGGSGMHSVKYGTVKDYVLDLEVVLPDGDVIHTGCKAPKTSAGYDLTRLYVGSEGTLGIITKARLRICALPETKSVSRGSIYTTGRCRHSRSRGTEGRRYTGSHGNHGCQRDPCSEKVPA